MVAASFLLRWVLVQGLGLEMPTFITFYPAIMVVALLCGLWPGVIAIALVAVGTDYLILPPVGHFAVARLSDSVSLVLFAAMGVFMSLVAEHYRRGQRLIADYKVEKALWLTKEKLEVALASMADAVFISDTSDHILDFNDAFVAFHRFPNRAECPRDLADFARQFEVFLPDGTPVPVENWSASRALRGETATNVEFNLRCKDTGEKWVGSYSFSPLRASDGSIMGAVVVARDVTEQKISQQKLFESERELSLMYRNMSDVVFYLAVEPGNNFRFISVNPAFLRATGLGIEQVIGKLTTEVIPEPASSFVLEKYAEAVRKGQTVSWEETSVYPAGEKHADVSIAPVFNAKGACTNLIGVLHDITERKQAEKHIEQLNRALGVLSDINQTIVRVKDSQAMLEAACRIAVGTGKFRMAWIGMIDSPTQTLKPIASSGMVDGYLDHLWIELDDPTTIGGPAAQSILNGKHAICNDIQHDPHYLPWRDAALQRGYGSSGGFPLTVDGNVVGVFNLYASEPGFFTQDELAVLDEAAMDISFALEVNLREEERRKAEAHVRQLGRVYSVLSDINQTIVREKDSQAMLEAACRIAVDKGEFRMAWIGMADPETHVLKPVASSGTVGGYLERVKIDLGGTGTATGPAALCFHSGEREICNDIEHELYRPWKDYALQIGYRSLAVFPLRCEGKTVGVFSIYANDLAFFDEEEIKLLDELAMDISFALEVNRHDEDRRKADEELLRRTALFEAQVDSALDGVLVVDGAGKKILQNQRLNDLMKIPPEIAGNPDDAQQRQFVSTLMKNPDQFLEKVDYLNSHPEEVSRDEIELQGGKILERYSSPVKDKANRYYGRIWTFRDITERRQLEEQFRQAQKMEAVGQLSGGIAHDFNNLLTVILGCAEFISQDAKENTRMSKMAEMILGAARRGAELTHRMLAFARRQTLQPAPVNVNRLLMEMEGLLRRTLSAEIDLEVARGGEDCVAVADPGQLESALLNLCLNARDAMPAGGKLTIETCRTALDAGYAAENPDTQPGEYILLAVSDSGHGISPEIMDRVFDPFFTTKDVGKGSGLGLSMVYGFVKQSKGHVKIYSEPGHGTSVKLYLPVADDSSEVPEQYPEASAGLHGSEVILVAEDNDEVREFAKAQLEFLGYRVLEAANGAGALTVLRDHAEIDLLFTDMVMPGGMSGHELAQVACRLRPTLKVLYCSGYAENAQIHEGLPLRGVEFLNKPYTRLELARRIRRVLRRS